MILSNIPKFKTDPGIADWIFMVIKWIYKQIEDTGIIKINTKVTAVENLIKIFKLCRSLKGC